LRRHRERVTAVVFSVAVPGTWPWPIDRDGATWFYNKHAIEEEELSRSAAKNKREND